MKKKHLLPMLCASLLALSACEEKSALEKAGDNVNDALDRRPAEDIGDAAKDFGKAVGDTAKDVAGEASDAARDAADEARDAARSMKDAAKETMEE